MIDLQVENLIKLEIKILPKDFNMTIKNKYLHEKFDNLRANNKMPFMYGYGISSTDYVYYVNWELEDFKIKQEFIDTMLYEYGCSDKTIETAYEIIDLSDNGFSYKEVEQYIVILQNLINHESSSK